MREFICKIVSRGEELLCISVSIESICGAGVNGSAECGEVFVGNHGFGGTAAGATNGAVTTAGMFEVAGVGVATVPTPAVGVTAVGTADVPITGIFAQMDCNEIPLAIGAIAAAAFVASINI